MTAPATVSRPVLYLVPGGRRAAPEPRVELPTPPHPPRSLPGLAAESTARVLGTMFGPVAGRLAEGLGLRAPLLLRRARPELWAAAIAFLLAEESRLFDYDGCVTRTSLARELGPALPTLRRRAAQVRAALDPLHLDLPDPEDG